MSRDDELLVKAALAARLPWLSPDAEPEYTFSTDSQELINKCCQCTMNECVDCLSNSCMANGRPKGSRKADIKAFAEMLINGLTQKQVCDALGIGKQTFYNYKNQLLNTKGAIA